MTAAVLAFLSQAWPYIAGGIAVVAAYFGVKMKGASDERQKIDTQVAQQTIKAQSVARKVDNEVARKTDDAVTDELSRDWVRNK